MKGTRGLGAAIANLFAENGAHVALNYFSDVTKAQELADELQSRYKVQATCLQGVRWRSPYEGRFYLYQFRQYVTANRVKDVGVASDCEKLIEGCVRELGGLDVVISNAVSRHLFQRPIFAIVALTLVLLSLGMDGVLGLFGPERLIRRQVGQGKSFPSTLEGILILRPDSVGQRMSKEISSFFE